MSTADGDTPNQLQFRDYLDIARKWCHKYDGTVLNKTKSKSIGTHFEETFRDFIYNEVGTAPMGNAAKGVDLPQFNVDVKTTDIGDPQSSNKFCTPLERITGLDHGIFLVLYDSEKVETGTKFTLVESLFVPKEYTADAKRSREARQAISDYNTGHITRPELKNRIESIIEIGDYTITSDELDDLIENPPTEGIITISPAVQWRLSYSKTRNAPDAESVYSPGADQSTLSNFL